VKYGHFTDDYREYVITNPKTPRSWDNHISNEEYGMVFNQVGGGMSVLPVPDGNRVTYAGADSKHGKFFYVRDNETGRFWSSCIEPVAAAYEQYEGRHGLGWSRVSSTTEGIKSSLTVFVPLEDPCEIWNCSLENTSSRRRAISVFPFVEWHLVAHTAAWDDYTWYTQADYRKDENLIVCTLQNPKIPGRSYQGFMGIDIPFDGYDVRLADFYGDGDLTAPQAVSENTSHAVRCVSSDRAGGVYRMEFVLEPGERKAFHVLIGLASGADERKKLVEKYLAPGAPDEHQADVKAYWDKACGTAVIHTPDEKLNAMTNIWAKYNIHMLTRSLRPYYKGYRDSLQDAMAISVFAPEVSRRILRTCLAYQWSDGSAVRQFSVSAGPDDVRKYYDSPAWILPALGKYLKETGDLALLGEEIPFYRCDADGMKLEPAEFGTVYEHALRAVDWLMRQRGRHGLIRIGRGDWNDALDQVGRGGKGVSIWLSALVHGCLIEMAEICRLKGDRQRDRSYRDAAAELFDIINEHGWDGEWFLRAIHDGGRKIGSSAEKAGRIYLLPQACTVLWGAATSEHASAALDAIDRHLETEIGPMLLAPPYLDYDPEIGRLSIIAPGFGENGNIYVHAGLFACAANFVLGRAERGYELYKKLTPIYEHRPAEKTRAAPYSYVNCFGGPHYPEKFGVSLYNWYSASADWAFLIALENICGLYGTHEGLVVNPCLPEGFDRITASRPFRGDSYEVEILNPDRLVGKGDLTITVDGKQIEGNIVKPFGDRKTHTVKVEMQKTK